MSLFAANAAILCRKEGTEQGRRQQQNNRENRAGFIVFVGAA